MMFGFEIGIGIILALACVCVAPFLVIGIIGALLSTLGRLIQAYERSVARRLTAPASNWFNRLSDGTQLMLAAFGTIGLMFCLPAIGHLIVRF